MIAITALCNPALVYCRNLARKKGFSPKLNTDKWLGPYVVVRKINYLLFVIKQNKSQSKGMHHDRLKPYLSNSWCIIGIIIKIVKLSLKWYPTYYDYLWHGSVMLQNVEQAGQRWKAAKCLKFHKSFTVWKSEFDHLLLFYSSKSIHIFNIIIQIVKLSLKWYLTCCDNI